MNAIHVYEESICHFGCHFHHLLWVGSVDTHQEQVKRREKIEKPKLSKRKMRWKGT